MNSKIVGVTAILATFVILAYAVYAVQDGKAVNGIEQACDNVPEDAPARGNANDNSVLSSCVQPPTCVPGVPLCCGNGDCEYDIGEVWTCPQDCG